MTSNASIIGMLENFLTLKVCYIEIIGIQDTLWKNKNKNHIIDKNPFPE